MIIRRATEADVKLLAELNQDVQRIHAEALPDWFKQPNQVDAVAVDFATRILGDTQEYVYIAEVNGEAVGYICARRVERPENPYTYAQTLMLIDQISVKPRFQGCGCGRKLIQTVVDLAMTNESKRVILDTYAFNTQAQGFFGEMGFARISMRYQMALDFNT